MKKTLLTLTLLGASLSIAVGAQGLPWYQVPVQWGGAGAFTCVTQPNPVYGAVITCDPGRFNALPASVQAFLLAHEHGHVYQFKHGQQFAPNPEADADCYAAKHLAGTNPQALAQAIQWLGTVMANGGGGDGLHGTGAQVAQFASQCAYGG
jgi:hypothetical protein